MERSTHNTLILRPSKRQPPPKLLGPIKKVTDLPIDISSYSIVQIPRVILEALFSVSPRSEYPVPFIGLI